MAPIHARAAGFAYVTAQAAVDAANSAAQVAKPANDAVQLGSPYLTTDSAASLVVLSGHRRRRSPSGRRPSPKRTRRTQRRRPPPRGPSPTKILLSAGVMATLENDASNPERLLVFGMMSDLPPALRPTFVSPAV